MTSDDSSAVWVVIGLHLDCAIAALVDFVFHYATAMIFSVKDTLAVLQGLLQKQSSQVESSPEGQDTKVRMNQSDVEFQVNEHQIHSAHRHVHRLPGVYQLYMKGLIGVSAELRQRTTCVLNMPTINCF